MSIGTVKLGNLTVSRLILGGNTFSAFSHQNPARDLEMKTYYTTARIKETLAQAEKLGITAYLGRADRHMGRVLFEYWNEGGKIKWIAQTASELISLDRSIQEAINNGAHAIYLHGGKMENLMGNNQLDQVAPAIAKIRAAGLAVGLAGHDPAVHAWADKNADIDFHMCSYYIPSHRIKNAEHVPGQIERFDDRDRDAMVAMIQTLRRPVIHYKIFAAGRNEPRAAFRFAVTHMRPMDAICFAVFTKDKPNMIAEDIALYEEAMATVV